MIEIYHCKGGTSDKIWAINLDPIEPGKYEIFYGKRTNALIKRIVRINNPYAKIDEKRNKDYYRVDGTIEDTPFAGIRYTSDHTQAGSSTALLAPKPKPKKRPKKIVNLSRINTDNHSAFF
jgi:hypothetical protein